MVQAMVRQGVPERLNSCGCFWVIGLVMAWSCRQGANKLPVGVEYRKCRGAGVPAARQGSAARWGLLPAWRC